MLRWRWRAIWEVQRKQWGCLMGAGEGEGEGDGEGRGGGEGGEGRRMQDGKRGRWAGEGGEGCLGWVYIVLFCGVLRGG